MIDDERHRDPVRTLTTGDCTCSCTSSGPNEDRSAAGWRLAAGRNPGSWPSPRRSTHHGHATLMSHLYTLAFIVRHSPTPSPTDRTALLTFPHLVCQSAPARPNGPSSSPHTRPPPYQPDVRSKVYQSRFVKPHAASCLMIVIHIRLSLASRRWTLLRGSRGQGGVVPPQSG